MFYSFMTLATICYSIASIIIGILLMAFGIYQIAKCKRRLVGILAIIHSLLFIGFGIFGFFVPKTHEVIVVLAMLAFTITMILSLLLFFKKEEK